MNHGSARRLIAIILTLCLCPVTCALAWTDQAHLAMGLAAGFPCFYNCAAPDISHTVATVNGLSQTDRKAHFYNVPDDHTLTVEDAYAQLQYIGQPAEDCPYGYLLGAILQATRLCKEKTGSGAYDDEYYAVLLHYVADLAQPLHMSTYDDFNVNHHFACDHILSDTEAEVPVIAAMALADELTVEDTLHFETEEQMLEAVLDLAARSRDLGRIMYAEQRNLSREEALLQVSRAASLGRAILKYCGKLQ